MSGRLSEDELDDIKARNPIADVASGYTRLRRAAGRLVGPCPVCGGKVASQRFEVFEKDNSWVCAVCPDGGDVIRLVEKVEACSFRDAIEKLGGRVEIDAKRQQEIFEERERKRLAQEKSSANFREKERTRLHREIWKKAQPIHDTIAARYLFARGLELPARCHGLRFMPELGYFHGETIDDRSGRKSARMIHKGPAMVGAFIRADGKFGGLHLTWLDVTSQDDVVKAEISDPDTGEIINSKKMRGSKTGAHILVAQATTCPDAPRRMTIGEGIETVLSVFTAFHLAGRDIGDMEFRAAGDLGNLAGRASRTIAHPTLKRPNNQPQRVPDRFPDPDDVGLTIPDSVQELILLGDGDSEPLLTECAMERAARRYARSGRVIRIAMATSGLDFNDVLRAA